MSALTLTRRNCESVSPAAKVASLATLPVNDFNVISPGTNCDTVASQPSAGTPVMLVNVTVNEPSSAVDFTILLLSLSNV